VSRTPSGYDDASFHSVSPFVVEELSSLMKEGKMEILNLETGIRLAVTHPHKTKEMVA
jgi:hypothetical protein